MAKLKKVFKYTHNPLKLKFSEHIVFYTVLENQFFFFRVDFL